LPGTDSHRRRNSSRIPQSLRGYPVLTVAAMEITSQHAEAESQGSWACVKKRFFLYRVALGSAYITEGHPEDSPPIEADFADTHSAIRNRTAVPTGMTPNSVTIELFVETAFDSVFLENLRQCSHIIVPRFPNLTAA
jgi:hypothetical protein